MSLLHNINKCVYLTLDNNTAQASAYVSVSFPVKEIIVRQIAYQDDVSNVDLKSFGTLHSDMVQNQALGIVALVSTNNATGTTGTGHILPPSGLIRFCYRTPVSIGGQYTFTLRDLTGNQFNLGGIGNYNIAVILEFIEYKGEITDVSA